MSKMTLLLLEQEADQYGPINLFKRVTSEQQEQEQEQEQRLVDNYFDWRCK